MDNSLSHRLIAVFVRLDHIVMRLFRLVTRALWLTLTVLWGFLAVVLLYPILGAAPRLAIKRSWSRHMLRCCGLRLTVMPSDQGFNAPERGELVVMNHISFIDILVLDALRPVHFIAKSEIRDWPLIGTLCARTGTIFIERGKRHAVHDVLKTMADQLRAGEVVSFFPEGTTSDGSQVLPFHANLFEAAVRAQAMVRPLVISYWQAGHRSLAPAFIDDLSLVDCAVAVLAATGIEVRLKLLDAIPSEGLTRQQLAAKVREQMLEYHRQDND